MKQLRKSLSLFCALAMALACLSIPALAEETAFAGGSGTADDPWQIASVDQLAYLAATVNDGSKSGYMGAYFVLTADLDMTGVDLDAHRQYERHGEPHHPVPGLLRRTGPYGEQSHL